MGGEETVLKYLHLFAQHRMGQMETANRWEFLELLIMAYYGQTLRVYNDFALPILAWAYHWERHWPWEVRNIDGI